MSNIKINNVEGLINSKYTLQGVNNIPKTKNKSSKKEKKIKKVKVKKIIIVVLIINCLYMRGKKRLL